MCNQSETYKMVDGKFVRDESPQEPITITVVEGSFDCRICGATELVDPNETDPLKFRWQVRPNKVCDNNGVWWSQCLVCQKKYGDGWFGIDGDSTVVSNELAKKLEAEGHEVTYVEV